MLPVYVRKTLLLFLFCCSVECTSLDKVDERDEKFHASEDQNQWTRKEASFGEPLGVKYSTSLESGLNATSDGLFHRTPRIVGGSSASAPNATFFVMLLLYDTRLSRWHYMGCGGTLVSSHHVLTAGHCMKGRTLGKIGAYINAFQPFNQNAGAAFHFSLIQDYKIHPDFHDESNANDVAVLMLREPADVSQFRPILLATPSLETFNDAVVTVYGFGRQSESSAETSQTLQIVNMPFISRHRCMPFYGRQLRRDMFCAGYIEGGADACQGDSGGPLTVGHGTQEYQLGIVSWGGGCGRALKPGVYTSVQYHYIWLQSVVCGTLDENLALCHLVTARGKQACKSSGQTCSGESDCCSGTCEKTSNVFNSQSVCS